MSSIVKHSVSGSDISGASLQPTDVSRPLIMGTNFGPRYYGKHPGCGDAVVVGQTSSNADAPSCALALISPAPRPLLV